MNESILRREWGAMAFLVATALGIIVVPVGLNLNKRNVPAATESLISASPGASPAGSPVASPSPSPSAAATATPTPAPAATPSPSGTTSPAATAPVPTPSP